jgi:hypothetical protein
VARRPSPRSPDPVRPSAARGSGPLEPEVLPPESQWIERIAWLMDRSIPIGKKWSIGLEAIIGLVPGVGDIAGILVGSAIVVAAIKARLPRSAIARMVSNVALDGLVGAIPFLGDAFDMVFKANTRNVQIFREAVRGRHEPVKDSTFTAGVALVFLLLLAVPVVVILLLIRAVGVW